MVCLSIKWLGKEQTSVEAEVEAARKSLIMRTVNIYTPVTKWQQHQPRGEMFLGDFCGGQRNLNEVGSNILKEF